MQTRTTEIQMSYIMENQIGGAMIWAIDFDDDQLGLLSTVANSGGCDPLTKGSQLTYKCSPINEQRWWTYDDGEASFLIQRGDAIPHLWETIKEILGTRRNVWEVSSPLRRLLSGL